ALLAAGPVQAQAPAKGGPARLDHNGDPLPNGALARLGSARFRHAEKVTGLAFLPDGQALVSSSWDGTLRLWEVPTARELRRFDANAGYVCPLALSGDGKLLLSGGNDRTTRLWDVRTGRELRRLGRHEQAVIAVALAPNQALVASGATDGKIRI